MEMRVILLGLGLLLAGCFQDPTAQAKRLLGQHVSPGAAEEEAYRMACAFAFMQSDTVQAELSQIVGTENSILPELITSLKIASFLEQSGGDSKALLLGIYQDLETVYRAQNKACEVLQREWRFFQEDKDLWMAGVEIEVEEPLTGIPEKVFVPCYEVRLDWGTVEEQTPGTCLWYWVAKLESFKEGGP